MAGIAERYSCQLPTVVDQQDRNPLSGRPLIYKEKIMTEKKGKSPRDLKEPKLHWDEKNPKPAVKKVKVGKNPQDLKTPQAHFVDKDPKPAVKKGKIGKTPRDLGKPKHHW